MISLFFPFDWVAMVTIMNLTHFNIFNEQHNRTKFPAPSIRKKTLFTTGNTDFDIGEGRTWPGETAKCKKGGQGRPGVKQKDRGESWPINGGKSWCQKCP
ncbi:MAG: hypothetical protein MI747_05800, partial [Desulfobacterales bacterium]|nr:hypothetical protein [Desulfobacterales bacterium]